MQLIVIDWGLLLFTVLPVAILITFVLIWRRRKKRKMAKTTPPVRDDY